MRETELIAGGLQQLNRMAVEAAEAGHLEDALVLFRKSFEFEERLNFGGHAAETLMNIATTCLMMGNLPKAIEAVDEAIRRFQEQRRFGEQRKAAIFKGSLLLAQHSWLEAATQFDFSLRMSTDPDERASIYVQAAAALTGMGQYYRAQEYLGRAIAEYDRLKDLEKLAAALKQRAKLFKNTGRRDMAIGDLRRCSSISGSTGDPNTEYEGLS